MLKANKADTFFSFLFRPLDQQQERQIIAAFVAVGLFLCATFALNPLQAHAQNVSPHRPTYSNYNCRSPHCYVQRDWYGAVLGSQVTIKEGFITCGTCDGFIDNEMWLADIQSSICVSVSACWVEAGYSTYTATQTDPASSCLTNSAANCYFWADNRPGSGSYHEHVFANVPSSDYGNNTTYSLTQNSSSSWNVQINTASGNVYGGLSTVNPMTPQHIRIGQELAGSNGTTANRTDFYYSEWEDTLNGYFHYQTNGGTIPPNTLSNPPYGHWAVTPNGSNNGGDFCTGC